MPNFSLIQQHRQQIGKHINNESDFKRKRLAKQPVNISISEYDPIFIQELIHSIGQFDLSSDISVQTARANLAGSQWKTMLLFGLLLSYFGRTAGQNIAVDTPSREITQYDPFADIASAALPIKETNSHAMADGKKILNNGLPPDYCFLRGWLEDGWNPNIQDDLGQTFLHAAAYGQSLESVQLLLRHGADPNIRDNRGIPPLGYAVLVENTNILKALLSNKRNPADPNMKYDAGRSAFHVAIMKGHVEMVATLLDHGADISVKTDAGESPMLLAVHRKENKKVIKLLADKGAAVSEPNLKGFPFLHLLADFPDLLSNAEYLISLGADVNEMVVIKNTPFTPVISAVMTNNSAMLKLLLVNDADPQGGIKTPGAPTPLKIAIKYGFNEIADLLREYGGKLEADPIILTPPKDLEWSAPLTVVQKKTVKKLEYFGMTQAEQKKFWEEADYLNRLLLSWLRISGPVIKFLSFMMVVKLGLATYEKYNQLKKVAIEPAVESNRQNKRGKKSRKNTDKKADVNKASIDKNELLEKLYQLNNEIVSKTKHYTDLLTTHEKDTLNLSKYASEWFDKTSDICGPQTHKVAGAVLQHLQAVETNIRTELSFFAETQGKVNDLINKIDSETLETVTLDSLNMDFNAIKKIWNEKKYLNINQLMQNAAKLAKRNSNRVEELINEEGIRWAVRKNQDENKKDETVVEEQMVPQNNNNNHVVEKQGHQEVKEKQNTKNPVAPKAAKGKQPENTVEESKKTAELIVAYRSKKMSNILLSQCEDPETGCWHEHLSPALIAESVASILAIVKSFLDDKVSFSEFRPQIVKNFLRYNAAKYLVTFWEAEISLTNNFSEKKPSRFKQFRNDIVYAVASLRVEQIEAFFEALIASQNNAPTDLNSVQALFAAFPGTAFQESGLRTAMKANKIESYSIDICKEGILKFLSTFKDSASEIENVLKAMAAAPTNKLICTKAAIYQEALNMQLIMVGQYVYKLRKQYSAVEWTKLIPAATTREFLREVMQHRHANFHKAGKRDLKDLHALQALRDQSGKLNFKGLIETNTCTVSFAYNSRKEATQRQVTTEEKGKQIIATKWRYT